MEDKGRKAGWEVERERGREGGRGEVEGWRIQRLLAAAHCQAKQDCHCILSN